MKGCASFDTIWVAFFSAHCDGSYQRTEKEKSFHTIMIYLNAGGKNGSFLGGSTIFPLRRRHDCFTEYVPTCGGVLVFDHLIYHKGATLQSGVKYAIRTDVMFKRKS